ncbi:hypothetical protein PRUPE_1G206100 [Prunus persica]|uniref:Uncharacterized protein n=1 Tax=Prunus persica TaxID=3760 RepID=M5XHW4_PRUPE|nr:hypothetical protein PRUPE_1G206100 [Prunus persica]
MGFGATASKIEGQVSVRDQFNRLENEVIELKNQMIDLLTRIATGEINIVSPSYNKYSYSNTKCLSHKFVIKLMSSLML